MKTKIKTVFKCQECGYSTGKWLGKCPDCGKWNCLQEEPVISQAKQYENKRLTEFTSDVYALTDLSHEHMVRYKTNIAEFDRLLGGGIVSGSLLLLGGPPGIGKSTLMLQVAVAVASQVRVMYVSGEESLQQIKSRADRLNISGKNMYVLAETDIESILKTVEEINPKMLIIDSIQTVFKPGISGSPGTVSQIRECTAEFLHLAKIKGITVFVLGHVTKEGAIAGPRVLEHIVDTVLYFEEEKQLWYRLLRVFKNRFGPTAEIGLFEMSDGGLREINNPSEIFLNHKHEASAGSVITATIEGTRPLMIEIQSLVTKAHIGFPKRQVNGFDYNRVILLTAVLEKKLGLHLETEDIFINIVGGIKIKETAVDLGICCAVASAYMDFVVDNRTVVIGEVGLSGEVRAVSRMQARLHEAEKLGFNKAVVPQRSLKDIEEHFSMKITGVSNLKEVIDIIK